MTGLPGRIIRTLDPVAYLERALQRRLIRRAEGYAADFPPGSPQEAEWITVTEKLRADLDGRP